MTAAPPPAPGAVTAFLRGADRRARLFARVQAGGADAAAEQARQAVARVFASEAGQWSIAEWPGQFWRLLLAAPALRRRERADAFLAQQSPWLAAQPDKTVIVLRGFAHQFAAGGTEALESPEFWRVPEIARAGGLKALAGLGKGVEVVKDVKMRLFGA